MKLSVFVISILLIGLIALFGCTNENNVVACTEEAKICPDGSAVGRIGPNCEFADCPKLPKNCVSWFDGCNNCTVENGELSACTLRYCENLAKAYCTQYVNSDSKPSGIANPASTNCIDNNGTLKIVDTNEGQIGICALPNGKECEEWAYFRGEC